MTLPHTPCTASPCMDTGFANTNQAATPLPMTTKLTLILAVLIGGFFVLDHYVLHLNAFVFLAKKLIELMNYMSIWR